MQFSTENELYQVIGSNIKYYREQAKLTQIQLADKVPISISYLSKLEASGCNKSMSISILNHIANILNVDITDFLLGGNLLCQEYQTDLVVVRAQTLMVYILNKPPLLILH
jgi:transcriptional regulator with XRE-family HTH domain